MDNNEIVGQTDGGQEPEKQGAKPAKRVRERTTQVKPCKRIYKPSGNGNAVKGSVDMAIYKRICSQLGRRWDYITSKEISLLCGVVLYLQIKQKRTCNKDDVLRFHGFRIPHVIKKQIVLLEKLADKGFLLRVQYDSGSIDRRGYGYGLTEYGQAFINDLDREFDNARQWVEDQNRLKDVVLYLDRVKEQLHPRQRPLFTSKQIEQLKAIGKG